MTQIQALNKKVRTEEEVKDLLPDPKQTNVMTYVLLQLLEVDSILDKRQENYNESINSAIGAMEKNNDELKQFQVKLPQDANQLAQDLYNQALGYGMRTFVKNIFGVDCGSEAAAKPLFDAAVQKGIFLSIAKDKIAKDQPQLDLDNKASDDQRQDLLQMGAVTNQLTGLKTSQSQTVANAQANTQSMAGSFGDVIRKLTDKIEQG